MKNIITLIHKKYSNTKKVVTLFSKKIKNTKDLLSHFVILNLGCFYNNMIGERKLTWK